MNTITRYFARSAGCESGGFEVEAETLTEAQKTLENNGFNGFLYEITYQHLTTTPHIIGKIE